MAVIVFVDAENVRRSVWPNIGRSELLERCAVWAAGRDERVVVVFDGVAPADVEGVEAVASAGESADDWIARAAASADGPYWLVTSDRELRERAGESAERVVGGGAFARALPEALQ